MDILHERCGALDVHKATVVACVRVAKRDGAERRTQSFQTTTAALSALGEWLAAEGVTCVAMEATGVYWKPVWHILSGFGLPLVLVNAAHVKNVPGRKTDMADAAWLADLAAHGLIRASFVPPQPVEELRTLMRTRKQLTRERVAHIQRLQKTLETANIKLDLVIKDIVGQSGRAILEALVAGESDPRKLAGLASRRIKATPAEIEAALRGRVTSHHRFMLRLHLDQIDAIDRAIAAIDAEADHSLVPFRKAAERLATIDGIAKLSATAILSEIGSDMSRFPTDGHLLSWACLVPRHDESAGKRRSTRLRKGGTWLKTMLVQCAWAGVRKKSSPLNALFMRIKARRGAKKAIIAVAAEMLRAAYHILKTGNTYAPHPARHERRNPEQQARYHLKRLASLGYDAQITKRPTAAPALVSF